MAFCTYLNLKGNRNTPCLLPIDLFLITEKYVILVGNGKPIICIINKY